MKNFTDFLKEGLNSPDYVRIPTKGSDHPFHKSATDSGYQYYGSVRPAPDAVTHTFTHGTLGAKKPVVHLSSWNYKDKEGNEQTQHSWSTTKNLSSPHHSTISIGKDSESLHSLLNKDRRTKTGQKPVVSEPFKNGEEPSTPVKPVLKPTVEPTKTGALVLPVHPDEPEAEPTSRRLLVKPRISGTNTTSQNRFLNKASKQKKLDREFTSTFKKREKSGVFKPKDFSGASELPDQYKPKNFWKI